MRANHDIWELQQASWSEYITVMTNKLKGHRSSNSIEVDGSFKEEATAKTGHHDETKTIEDFVKHC